MILRLHYDNRPLSFDQANDTGELGVADQLAARLQIRSAWSKHAVIATIPSVEVVAAPGAERDVEWVENMLAEIIHDLGNSCMDNWWGARQAVANAHLVACEPKQDGIRGAGMGHSAICIGSGPTARHHLRQIARCQGRHIIIVADSIFNACCEAGIRPHFVTAIERVPEIARLMSPDLCPTTWLCAPPIIHPDLAAHWAGRRLWWWQGTEWLYRWLGHAVPGLTSGRTAGTLSVALAHALACNHVYLVGHDLCHVDGQSHDPGATELTRQMQIKDEADQANRLHQPIKVRCHDGVERRSTVLWGLLRTDIAGICSGRPGITFSIGDKGAEIPGVPWMSAIPVPSGEPWHMPDRPKVTMTRYNRRCGSQVIDALTAFRVMAQAWADAPTHQARTTAFEDMVSIRWAHRDVADLIRYVCEPVFTAASVRMHLRRKEGPSAALTLGGDIISRGCLGMLSVMVRDIEGLQ